MSEFENERHNDKPSVCPVCGCYSYKGELCAECRECKRKGEQIKREERRRKAFGVGSASRWTL